MKGLKTNLEKGILEYLHLVKLKPRLDAWTALSNGLQATRSLRTLQINNFEFTKDSLEILCCGVKLNSTLKVLDLSFCAIEDKFAN